MKNDRVEHVHRVFATAEDVLHKIQEGHLWPSSEYGSVSRIRKGKKRQVSYIEVADGSGPTLRIEVFIV